MTTKTQELDRAIEAIIMAVDFETPVMLELGPLGTVTIMAAQEEGERIAIEVGGEDPLNIFKTQKAESARNILNDVLEAVRDGGETTHAWNIVEDAITELHFQDQLTGFIIGVVCGFRQAGSSRSETKEFLKIFLRNFAAQEETDAQASGAAAH